MMFNVVCDVAVSRVVVFFVGFRFEVGFEFPPPLVYRRVPYVLFFIFTEMAEIVTFKDILCVAMRGV